MCSSSQERKPGSGTDYSTTGIRLYNVYVWPHLENTMQSWSPWTRKDIEILEKVQRKALKMTTGLKGQTYEQRLLEVNLASEED